MQTSTRAALYGNYCVFESGAVMNTDGSYRKHNLNHKGYVQVSMKIDDLWTTRQLHKLLYELFVGSVPEGFEVDHIDNDRSNFKLDNLQLLTRRENRLKSYSSGNRDVSGVKNANSKLTQRQIDRIPHLLLDGYTQKDIAKAYGVSSSCINKHNTKYLIKHSNKSIGL